VFRSFCECSRNSCCHWELTTKWWAKYKWTSPYKDTQVMRCPSWIPGLAIRTNIWKNILLGHWHLAPVLQNVLFPGNPASSKISFWFLSFWSLFVLDIDDRKSKKQRIWDSNPDDSDDKTGTNVEFRTPQPQTKDIWTGRRLPALNLNLAMSAQTEPQQNSKAEALHLYGSYPFATDENYQVGAF